MKRTQQLIAVALVATALCADRAIAAAPEARPQMSVAGRIVERLTSGLRRAVSRVRIYQAREEVGSAKPQAAKCDARVVVVGLHPNFGVFEFRLPPPVC
ncbi:MAG TPA: hypothetical protein VHS31_11190 [Tepidisphaeraceae bacterium]|jgi:hypothetical protein|nr:hypothetical protein [Tepidisphaeraceae bacterium]